MAHTPSLKPRALSPSPLPHLHSHQYAVPGLWEARREAELAACRQLRPLMWLPVRKECCERAGGTARKLKLHLGLLTGVLSSGWAACSPFSLHRAGVLHRAPFLHISDVFAISLATAGPHLPCQAGQGCTGGTGPAQGESFGWWRHRSNHLVNASKPGHRNPFAFPGSDNYMHLTRNKKGRPKASLASKPNEKKTQTNKLLQQQPCSSSKDQWHSGLEGAVRIIKKCHCPSTLNELTDPQAHLAKTLSGEWGGQRCQSPFWHLVPRFIYSLACKPACTGWGVQHPPTVYAWVPGETAFGLQP